MSKSNKKFYWQRISDPVESIDELMFGNEIRTIEVGGKQICITVYQGRLHAFEHNCPHAGASLGQGWIDNDKGQVVCFLHRYAFDLETGANTINKECNLKVYPVMEDETGIYIGFKKPGIFNWF